MRPTSEVLPVQTAWMEKLHNALAGKEMKAETIIPEKARHLLNQSRFGMHLLGTASAFYPDLHGCNCGVNLEVWCFNVEETRRWVCVLE
ncbi:hypothetical protein J6590_010645 [Homalodisca vitripennis]|nr:hypothetical protein J6590_010645 [Homalodisca vitripennis]